MSTGSSETRAGRKPEIVLDDFVVSFPGFTLGPISTSIPFGECVAILGPNGSGKSTLLRGLAGLLPGYSGSLSVGPIEVRDDLLSSRRRVGLLPERLLGTPDVTVAGRLDFLAGFFPEWDRGYAEVLLSELDLDASSRIGTLSKGMALKLSFVAAEAFRPPILLLDEPTAGLDPVVRRTFMRMVKEISADQGNRTVVIATHLLEDVQAFADRVWILHDGRLARDLVLSELGEGEMSVEEALFSALEVFG